MDEIAKESQISDTFQALNAVEMVVSRVISEIPSMDDDQLEDVIIHAAMFEKGSFLIRGCAVAEIQSRIATRLKGGRGVRDVEGIGIGAHVAKLGHRLGISSTTLENDARVFRRFGEEILREEEPLPREMYLIALGCDDLADEAIFLAHTKKDDPGYGVRQFKLDCQRLCAGASGEEVEEIKWCSVPLSLEEYSWLKERSKRDGCATAETVKHLVQKAMKK